MTIKELKDLLNDEDFNDDMEIVVGLSCIQETQPLVAIEYNNPDCPNTICLSGVEENDT